MEDKVLPIFQAFNISNTEEFFIVGTQELLMQHEHPENLQSLIPIFYCCTNGHASVISK